MTSTRESDVGFENKPGTHIKKDESEVWKPKDVVVLLK